MELVPETARKLGFGLMRLPVLNGREEEIDLETLKIMVDSFISRGFTYFDTAYFYHNGFSETAVREALVRRYPRNRFLLADKMPLAKLERAEQVSQFFEEQLTRTGAGYFDFYLLHAVSSRNLERADEFHVWDFVEEKQRQGLVRHWGFSFHDTPELLDSILYAHPEAEFVQLQINYADWEDPSVQSRRCYETARKHGKPVIIMEPVKGGMLALNSSAAAPVLKAAAPDAPLSSWAFRFAGNLPGVMMVLSGMSTAEQLNENTELFKALPPLLKTEEETLEKAAQALKEAAAVPCTKCRYCVEGCPAHIEIPALLAVLNGYKRFGSPEAAKRSYGFAKKDGDGGAADCLNCGKCREVCPQHIDVPAHLGELAKIIDR